MEQNATDAAAQDAQTMLRKEECASGMGQHAQDAEHRGVQTKPSVEECALDTEQRSSDATGKDVQTMLRKEECAKGMGHIATQTKKTVVDSEFKNTAECPIFVLLESYRML